MSDRQARTTRGRRGGLAILPLVSMVAVTLGACGGPAAAPAEEEEHSHAGGGVVTAFTDDLELFVEFPPHVKDVPSDPWAVHLTWLEDWSPVREGRLTLLLRGPGGAREEIVMDAPARAGVYSPTPTLAATGTWRADMTLAANGREYAIPVGQLQVFESEQALPHEDPETPPADLIAFLKEQQWTMPFEVAFAEERPVARSIRVSGQIVAPPGGLAEVAAPVSGLVLASGPFPAPGQAVGAGQTLALLAPAGTDNSYAWLRADVERLEREVARTERLYAAEAVPERRLEEARQDLEVARAAFETLGGANAQEDDGGYVFRLVSPISGVVAVRHLTPGQRVEPGDAAFTVVNPARLWLRADVPARQAEAATGASGAWFTVEGGSTTHTADRVVSVGSVIDPATRTLAVHLSVPNPDGRLSVGMLAEVGLLVGDPETGVAIPTRAIQDEDGLPVVYVKLGGEAFQRRVVRPGPSDGTWTIVLSGIAAGEQVVTEGAYQVKLASLGDQEISDHGHPH